MSERNERRDMKTDGDLLKLPLRKAREVFERHYLLDQVNRFDGNITKTANFVGMERSALTRKLKTLGVRCERAWAVA
jgi:two-component system, NtrC family, nitrogen regulation response regulator NtrX